MLYVV